ncbi:hypothetical protein BTVI_148309 [Pitangus sulphuratus]|nr:hypothetical protein BTVI_148309 [Pitangus sulphuratus]
MEMNVCSSTLGMGVPGHRGEGSPSPGKGLGDEKGVKKPPYFGDPSNLSMALAFLSCVRIVLVLPRNKPVGFAQGTVVESKEETRPCVTEVTWTDVPSGIIRRWRVAMEHTGCNVMVIINKEKKINQGKAVVKKDSRSDGEVLFYELTSEEMEGVQN